MNDQSFPHLCMETCWAQFFFLVYAHTMHSQPPSGVTLLEAQRKNKQISKRQLYETHIHVYSCEVLASYLELLFTG